MSQTIPGFQGMQYSRDGDDHEKRDYNFFNQQYASLSYNKETSADPFYSEANYKNPGDHDLHPKLIVQPRRDEDVQAAVNWATAHHVSVAVKSGGHQYCGASSTSGENIQIDLTDTYNDIRIVEPQDPSTVPADRALIMVGVSVQLQNFNAYLASHDLFVPHGQCAFVCVGGHGQTGGYGQLGRSFGLFGDNIRKIRMVCYDGKIDEFSETNRQDIFRAILGGSPGNFGVITHYTVEVYRGKSYMGTKSIPPNFSYPSDSNLIKTVDGKTEFKGPHGIKMACVYTKTIFKEVLTILAQMSDNQQMARGYDLCVSVLSMDFDIAKLFPSLTGATEWDKIMKKIQQGIDRLEGDALQWLDGALPAVIVVYAQWAPTSPGQSYDADVDNWFNKFRNVKKMHPYFTLQMQEFDESLSTMSGKWIFPKKREFDLPYEKRTWATNSTTLEKDGWVDHVAERIHLIYWKGTESRNPDESAKRFFNGCRLAVQIQPFGGENSRFFVNRNNGTSYSWRDSTVVQVLDCFYKEGYKEDAEKWQAGNDKVFVGPNSSFSKQDRRMLWGSYGEWDLNKDDTWQYYYENAEKYVRLGKARAKADPNGTFTPNPFAVAAIPGARL